MRNSTLKRYKGLNKVSPKTAKLNREWNERVARLAQERAKGRCEVRGTDECKARGFKPDWRGLSGHHIIPRSHGRIDTDDNCIIGCGDCHDHSKFGQGLPISILEAQEIIAKGY